MKIHSLLLASALLPSVVSAKDFTVVEKPFRLECAISGMFLPVQSQSISVDPQQWRDFTITSVVPQGALVKKGDVLIGIDTKKIDEQIANLEKNSQEATLRLAQQKDELKRLEISTSKKLENAARAEKEAAENLKWFTEIGMPKEIAVNNNALVTAEQKLSYMKEELKQLEEMYKEDNKIEESEEIILTRTRNTLKNMEISLKFLRINVKHDLKTTIPRKLTSLKLAAERAKVANAAAKEDLPRALELKRLAVAKAIRDNKKSNENLAKLKLDRSMMEIKSPGNGLIYYGEIKKGVWNGSNASKMLSVGKKLPLKTVVMTFIPEKTPLKISGFIDESKVLGLFKNEKSKGFATSLLNPYNSFPVELVGLDHYPQTNGKFHVSLKPTLPDNLPVTIGMKANAKILVVDLKKSLKVPKDYVTLNANGGFEVKVKLADGKTESRTVEVGPSNQKWVVVTKGLDKGQVIVK